MWNTQCIGCMVLWVGKPRALEMYGFWVRVGAVLRALEMHGFLGACWPGYA